MDKKKICGILQETLQKTNITYIVVGVGLNLIKNPNINNYPTTNLLELTNKNVKKNTIISELKVIYENFINKSSKFNLKKIKNL